MSEPEIARRCPTCGVSIRVRAAFCPQCGKAIEQEPKEVSGTSGSNAETPPSNVIESKNAAIENPDSEKTTRVLVRPGSATPRAFEAPHRPASGAREAIEHDVLSRAQKLRKMSSVVLDEAGYDPSLRFVLVTAALFVLFLLILLLSKWIS